MSHRYPLPNASKAKVSFSLVSLFDELHDELAACVPTTYRFTEVPVRKAFEQKKVETLHTFYAELFLNDQPHAVVMFQVLTVTSDAYPDFSHLSAGARALYSMFSCFTLKLILSGNYFNPWLPAVYAKSINHMPDAGLLEILFTQLGRLLNADAVILQNAGGVEAGIDCNLFRHKRFKELNGDTLMQMQVNSSWLSLNDYVLSLSKKYRARAHKLMKDNADISVKTEGMDEWKANSGVFYKLYRNVYNRSSFKPVSTSSDFFLTLLTNEPERFFLRSFYNAKNELLAWSSLYKDEQGMEIFYIGIDTQKEGILEKIYPHLLLDGLQQAIIHRSPYFMLGRTGREAKSMLGAECIPLPHRVWFRNSLLKLLSRYLIRLAQQNEWKPVKLRNPFKEPVEN